MRKELGSEFLRGGPDALRKRLCAPEKVISGLEKTSPDEQDRIPAEEMYELRSTRRIHSSSWNRKRPIHPEPVRTQVVRDGTTYGRFVSESASVIGKDDGVRTE